MYFGGECVYVYSMCRYVYVYADKVGCPQPNCVTVLTAHQTQDRVHPVPNWEPGSLHCTVAEQVVNDITSLWNTSHQSSTDNPQALQGQLRP